MTKLSFQDRLLPEHVETVLLYTAETPVRVGALAKALGLRVVVAALPLNISGLIKPDGTSHVIKVNRFESKSRQRFTIAHEIAHFLLHRDRIQAGLVDSVLYRSKLSSRLEAEANRLAADILMPIDQVDRVVKDNSGLSSEELNNLLSDNLKFQSRQWVFARGDNANGEDVCTASESANFGGRSI